MKKLIRAVAASFVIVGLFASCATTSGVETEAAEKTQTQEKKKTVSKTKKKKFDQEAYNAAFDAGDYDTCLAMLNDKSGKKEERSAVRNELDADMLILLTLIELIT